jgi:hypothetical protein
LPWFRGRRFQLWARVWTVDHWYPAADAPGKFGDQDILRHFNEVQQKKTSAFLEWSKGYTISKTPLQEDKQYLLTKAQVERYGNLIREDLNEQLARGELIAKGFREPFSHGAPYTTISRHEWLVIKLVPPDHAQGGGVSYIGLTIGKAGTRSIFRRHKQ